MTTHTDRGSPETTDSAPSGIALCHEWLTTYGGSEQVAVEIANALDIEDIYTFTADIDFASQLFPEGRLHVTPLGQRRIAQRHWQWLLPMMARAWRTFDLTGYKAVITSSHSCVNSIETPEGTLHISYCHTPMRYAWDWRNEIARYPLLFPVWPLFAKRFRSSDVDRARNVDLFIANSKNVAARIKRFYGRDAEVVYPPVDTEYWTPADEPTRDYFLLAGRLVAYKRPDIAVTACSALQVPLVVAGAGPELPKLKKIAGPSVRFVESPSTDDLRELYRNAVALVFPGLEDFGMTMVEAQSCGTPVIAFGAGGALEAVDEDGTGTFFRPQTVDSLSEVLRSFSPDSFHSGRTRKKALTFSTPRFHKSIQEIVLAGA